MCLDIKVANTRLYGVLKPGLCIALGKRFSVEILLFLVSVMLVSSKKLFDKVQFFSPNNK